MFQTKIVGFEGRHKRRS